MAQARSALLASVPCAQYSVFPGGHCLRLAFGSFFLPSDSCCFLLFVQTIFFFFVVFGYTWFFVQSLFLRNLGRQFWRDVCLGVWPWLFAWLFRLLFHGLKVRQQLFCGFLPRRINCGFAFTGLAVKRLMNLAIKWSNELSGLAVHELSGSSGSRAQQLSGPKAQ